MKRAVAGVTIVLVALALMAGPAGAAKPRRPGPLRVLLIGDSITVNYQARAKARLEARGYQVFAEGIAGAGLLDAGQCRGHHAREAFKRVRPDVVVAQSNGNYGYYPVCAPRRSYGSTAFIQRWQRAAVRTQKILSVRGARFLWVLAPSVRSEPRRSVVPQLNQIYREIGPTIDAWTAFGGARFDQSLRSDDQHLNAAGAQRMADLVVAAVG